MNISYQEDLARYAIRKKREKLEAATQGAATISETERKKIEHEIRKLRWSIQDL